MTLKQNIARSRMKPSAALVSGFKPLTNATMNSISGVVRVLDPPLEHNNTF